MHKIQVDVRDLEFFKAASDSFLNIFFVNMLELGGDKNFLSFYARSKAVL